MRPFATIVLFASFVVTSFAQEVDHYFPLWQKRRPNITDLALIYQGGTQRPQWTTERFAPYVSYRDPKTGKEEWLFDGFLFVEFQDGNRNSYQPHPTMPPAKKDHWLALLEKNFAENDGIPNLQKVCHETAARIGSPARRRQVVITLPVPIAGQTNWGTLNGRSLDFRKPEDRLAALRWYMDVALQKWKTLSPQDLDLAGFYWVHESAPRTNDFLQLVAKEVHARQKQFFWIPCWHPNTLPKNWSSYGFDVAWQQPNHFFHPEVSDKRLDEACKLAKRYGMGLEMEFDGRMISDPEHFERRFDAYLDAFERHGVNESSSIAYYEGGVALYELSRSSDARMRAHYDRIARFIVTRQKAADRIFATEK